MKKIITFICISLFCTLTLSAQKKENSGEKIKALKISYLTEQLNLTSKEAEKFWPVYNTYDTKQRSLRNNFRTEIKKAIKEDVKTVSESDAKNLVSLKLTTDNKMHEAKKIFINDLQKIISNKKIIQLQIAEMEFGRKLMRKYKHKKEN